MRTDKLYYLFFFILGIICYNLVIFIISLIKNDCYIFKSEKVLSSPCICKYFLLPSTYHKLTKLPHIKIDSLFIEKIIFMYNEIIETENFVHKSHNDISTIIYKPNNNDLSFLFELIYEYTNTGILFIPQYNILGCILKNGKIDQKSYAKKFLNMGYIKLYHLLCTFVFIKNDLLLLNDMCQTNYTCNFADDEFEVTYKNIIERFDIQINESNIKMCKWLERIYNPLNPSDLLSYKYSNDVDKSIFLNNKILNHIDSLVLISDGKEHHVSILDYLIINMNLI